MDDLEYIKKFSKINIRKVCRKNNVDTSNLYKGKVKAEKITKVKKQIENDIAELYIIKEGEKDED